MRSILLPCKPKLSARSLCAFLLIILGGNARAQTFSFALRVGASPFIPPAVARAYEECKAKMTPLIGLKLALENDVVQIGLGIDGAELNYGYYNQFSVHSSFPFLNPNLTFNFKTKPARQFFYAGSQLGLLIKMKEKLEINETPMAAVADLAPNKVGFTAGAQIGGQIEMGRRVYLCIEGGVRYAAFATNLYDRQPSRWGNYFRASPENTSMFFFPLTLGLKLDI